MTPNAAVGLLRDLLMGGWRRFAKWAQPLEPAAIRQTLTLLEKAKQQRSTFSGEDDLTSAVIFIRAIVDDSTDARLLATWREAMTGLIGMQAYGWASKRKPVKLAQIAEDPRALAAWQAAAVGSQWVSRDVMALLLLDASEAALDALMPHFERAATNRTRLTLIERLAPFESAATAPLFSRARGSLTRHQLDDRDHAPRARGGRQGAGSGVGFRKCTGSTPRSGKGRWVFGVVGGRLSPDRDALRSRQRRFGELFFCRIC